ncbi:MAG: pitrilysin family protein, partial [Perlucidibaca sp.]
WKRQQALLRIGQRQRQQSPSARAALAFFKRLYGDHPYGSPMSGWADSVARITGDDLHAFHARYYTVRNAVLVLVGDLTRADAERISAQISARLPAGEAAPALPPVPPLPRAMRLHEEMPVAQMHVFIGEPGIAHGDPDTFPLLVGNELLGGSGFGTLLMRELRERRGLTYGVSSQFVRMRAPGPFQITFATRADQAEMALSLTRDLLRRFLAQGASADDVQAAIDTLVQAFPLSLASNDQVASYLGMMGFYDFPSDYLDHYVERLRTVTPEQVRDAFRRHVHPDRLLVVTVGRKRAPAPAATAAEAAAARAGARP